MINNLRSITAAAGYAHEVIRVAPYISELATEAGQDSVTKAYLHGTRKHVAAAAGVLAGVYYDIAHTSDGRRDTSARYQAEVNAAHTLLTADIVDDVVDERAGTLDDKFAYMDAVRNTMCSGNPPADADLHRSDPEKAAAIDLGLMIGKLWQEPAQRIKFSRVLDSVIEGAKKQFSETNPQRLLLLAEEIGGNCMDLAQIHVDIIDGVDNDERTAARHAGYLLGSYGEILDHFYETDQDLSAGVNTYSTARLRLEGDYPEVRRSIREESFDTANDCYQNGKSLLTKEQLVSYRALKMLVDIRYKFEIHLKRKQRAIERTPLVAQVSPLR